ncbi:TIGR02147 family protein [Peredibacter sp. HCB2-198]|uniref:TIGR02147 family protein n=1 Tax=Peredibacter sp. HCB2-198 TaxID=3383025 RepID=UPI0038B51B5B
MKTDITNNNQTLSPTEGTQILEILRTTFMGRKENNKAYSLTSFARDLGISKSILSRILSNERPVSVKLAMHLSAVLELEESQSKRVLLGVVQSQSKNAKITKKLKAKLEKELSDSIQNNGRPQFSTVDVEQFKAMCSWQHLAILNLIELKSFKNSPLWISKRLGISSTEARDAIERLFSLGLIIEENNKLIRTQKSLHVKTNRSEFAIRRFHEQMIEKALDELKNPTQERFEKRLINGITITCNEEHIPLIKQKIDQFQDEILAITSSAEVTQLYQMNMQFFPLTKTEE